jgi:ABC-type antimicrobial peptide transport system permease subunit
MKKTKPVDPPKWADAFLEWYCRPELLEDLQGDLYEYFQRNVETKGPRRARLIYSIDVLKFFRPYMIRKPKISNPLSASNMIRSHIKTSGRNIMRHKLFSTINISGLAISMCVGLLVIAFINDLFSYDNFHEKRDRIYRITTTDFNNSETMSFASSSVPAGRKIISTVPGIESYVFMQRGFGGDAAVDETIIPVDGIWASESFFDVFSFHLLKGNPATALQKPHSLVLTETTARRLFGSNEAMGKLVKFDTANYIVTGILKDVPQLSHIQFEALGSFSTIEQRGANADGDFASWENIYSNYTYFVMSKNADPGKMQAAIDKICNNENASLKNRKIAISIQPLKKIPVSKVYANQIGNSVPVMNVYILAALAFVVVVSACFNYTNLSMARSLNRSREVGIRKVIGALKKHVVGQFIIESVFISLFALVFAFILFLLIREPFLSLDRFVRSLVSLRLSPHLIVYFILFAVFTGLIAGLLPALFYSRITAIQVLNNMSSLKIFRHVNLRKSLIVVQYTFSLIFISTTVIGYHQYKGFLSYDLGFSTDNVLNINMQGNKSVQFVKDLSAMRGVKEVSKSLMISSLGSIYGSQMKYKDPMDSAGVQLNIVDEHYLSVHKYKLLAGTNFRTRPVNGEETEALVNEQVLKRFRIGNGDPQKSIGEVVAIDKKKLTIVGVLKDFHNGTLMDKIEPVMFRYSSEPGGHVNVRIATPDVATTLAGINTAWRKIDKVHALDAKFYDEQIEESYKQFSVMVKLIGFFAVLAIVIASMGLFGMVVYTTERRLKEISIRKVMGAGERTLMYLMSKNFLLLLVLSASIALPLTWLVFEKVILVKVAYHQPLRLSEQLLSFFIVMVIACTMIGLQTLKVARSSPAKVLKRE